MSSGLCFIRSLEGAFELMLKLRWDLFFCESDEFIVSVPCCLLVRETLCQREDESSNAEESQLDFMSGETPITTIRYT